MGKVLRMKRKQRIVSYRQSYRPRLLPSTSAKQKSGLISPSGRGLELSATTPSISSPTTMSNHFTQTDRTFNGRAFGWAEKRTLFDKAPPFS